MVLGAQETMDDETMDDETMDERNDMHQDVIEEERDDPLAFLHVEGGTDDDADVDGNSDEDNEDMEGEGGEESDDNSRALL
jgi:hypothetical protein